MGIKTFIGVEGKARRVAKLYVGVEGKARRVIKMYAGNENGRAKLCYYTETPAANAGNNQTIKLPVNSVTLNGSNSAGIEITYLWERVSGSGTITNPTSVSTTVTGLTAGNSVFRLTVTDFAGQVSTSSVTVTTNAAAGSAGYTSNATFTVPFGITRLTVSAVAKGGSGGGSSWSPVSGGGGGSGGRVVNGVYNVTPGGTIAIITGSGATILSGQVAFTLSVGGDGGKGAGSSSGSSAGKAGAGGTPNGVAGSGASGGKAGISGAYGNGGDGTKTTVGNAGVQGAVWISWS